jgi:hypothetical protein
VGIIKPALGPAAGRTPEGRNDFQITLLLPGQGIARLFPGVHPALEGLDVVIAPIQKLLCRPGRSMFLRSSALKDDLLVLGQVGELVLKLLKDERVFKLQATAFGFIGISTYQQGLARLHPGIYFLRSDSWRSSHDVSFYTYGQGTGITPKMPGPRA